jgi:5-methylthioadenosine/S-adenosylhomocysteine deaminase
LHHVTYRQRSQLLLEQGSSSREKKTEAKRLLIEGCALLAPGQAGGMLHNQDVLIVGKYIQDCGPSGTLRYDAQEIDQVIDGQGRLAMAGLINAHSHSLENVLQATSPSLPLELWLVPLFSDIIDWSPRLVYLSTLLGAMEMLKTGTTAVLDHLWTPDAVSEEYLDAAMQAYKDVGIRAAVAPSIEDRDLVLEAGTKRGIIFPHHPFIDRFESWPAIDEQVETLAQFISNWHNTENGRLRCLVGPSGIHWCSDALLHTCRDLAEQYATGMHLHAVETALQAKVIHELLGVGGINHLNKMHILKPGTSLAHAIWLEGDDLELLAQTGTTLVHNPISNLRLGSGRFPLVEALNKGVRVALGSDGSASNDTQNMFEVLKFAGLIHNQEDCDYKKWPYPVAILRAATCGGAEALGMAEELGKIAPGQLADITLLDLKNSIFLPLRDAHLHLVYCEQGGSVDTIIVNGELVMEQGTLLTVDERSIKEEMRELARSRGLSFSAALDSVENTREVLVKLDTLRRLILQQGKEHMHGRLSAQIRAGEHRRAARV